MWFFSNIFLASCVISFSGAGLFDFLNAGPQIHVKDLKISKCQEKSYPVQVQEAKLTENNDGFHVDFKVKTSTDLISPIKVKYNVLKKGLLGNYQPTPFSGVLKDVCQFGIPVDQECPAELVKLDIPCRCPIEKDKVVKVQKTVKVPEQVLNLKVLMVGVYKIRVEANQKGQDLGCYTATFNIS